MSLVQATCSLLDLEFRTITEKLHDEFQRVLGRPAWPRPAGLGILPFWLIFIYVVPEFKYSPKLMELVNVSDNHSNMVLKV